jgi:hypothetical protein
VPKRLVSGRQRLKMASMSSLLRCVITTTCTRAPQRNQHCSAGTMHTTTHCCASTVSYSLTQPLCARTLQSHLSDHDQCQHCCCLLLRAHMLTVVPPSGACATQTCCTTLRTTSMSRWLTHHPSTRIYSREGTARIRAAPAGHLHACHAATGSRMAITACTQHQPAASSIQTSHQHQRRSLSVVRRKLSPAMTHMS